MDKLDQLITKFKEVKEELVKSPPLLHDTVEGFMTGLKSLPKGSPERGKFITSHMNHGPFLNALSAHPDGKKMHGMLTNHLNSTANAGFTPGKAKTTVAKSDDDLDDELEKTYMSPLHRWGPSKPVIRGSADSHAGGMLKPAGHAAPKPAAAAAPAKSPAPSAPAKLTGSDKIAAVSKEKIHGISEKEGKAPPAKLTGLDRIRAESQRPIEAMNAKVKKDESCYKQETAHEDYKSKPFGKTINNSYSATPNGGNMQMSANEKLTLNKGGQWNLSKGDYGMSESGRPLDVGPEIRPEKPHAPKFKGSQLQVKNGKVVGPGVVQPPAPLKRSAEEEGEQLEKKHIGFKALEGKLEHEGHSEESAGAIAASIGRKKYGAHKMAEMAHKTEEAEKSEGLANAINKLKSETKITGAMNSLRAGPKPAAPVLKGECSKCHADPCECQSSGVLVDKMDGADMSPGSGV